MFQYSFERLEVWQLSIQLVEDIYSVTNYFPEQEKFGLTSQIRRAAISVSNNLAEGNSRMTNKSQANFIQIAYSSLIEVLNMLIISNKLNYITAELLLANRARIEELTNKINALYNHKLRNS
jgi:four helix bundle protein